MKNESKLSSNVIDLDLYRFYKAIKERLIHDGINCKFSYDDEVFADLVAQLRVMSISYPEFYTKIASHAMLLDSIKMEND